MALVDKLFISGSWIPSDVMLVAGTGSVLNTAEITGSGKEISDEYLLTVSGRSGGTGTITVTTQSSNNPYNNRVKTLLAFDDATEQLEIVPGLTIVLDNAAANGDTVTIKVGKYNGSFDASGVDAGVPSAGTRHKVTNTGTQDVTEAKAKLLTQAVHVKKTGDVFSTISPFADGATEKVAGGGSTRTMPYALSIDNTSGSGPTKVADLKVDGVTFGADTIQDLSTGATQDGTGLKAIDPPYLYQVVDGDLEGLLFSLHPDCVDDDTANILIFPSRFTQIAEDTAGVEGTYGTSDVDLTEAGQSVGVITPSADAYYWVRQLVPSGAGNESNPYPSNVALTALEAVGAGWEE